MYRNADKNYAKTLSDSFPSKRSWTNSLHTQSFPYKEIWLQEIKTSVILT